ncbi:recombinase family protein [Plantactinospora veratri]
MVAAGCWARSILHGRCRGGSWVRRDRRGRVRTCLPRPTARTADPHPNRAHAAWGRRLHRLAPDPATAPFVRWIFERRPAGYGVTSIARRLNDTGVPCPSGADPSRNPHRSGHRWMLTTVAAILANPRYTGRQVWNRQRTDHDDLMPDGTVARHREVQRWNAAPQWVISRQIAHPLVTEERFIAVQAIHTAPTRPRHHSKNPRPTGRGSRKTRRTITLRVEITCPRGT